MPAAATRIRSSWTCRPSIWIANKSRDDRSLASQSFSFALDRATNLRDTADFEVPSPLIEATSPSGRRTDRKSTRLNSSHLVSSYAVFCLKKKKTLNTSMEPKDEACTTH